VTVARGHRLAREPLAGAVAVVTGAASGIGSALAVQLAQAGAAVVMADIDGDRLGQRVEELRARGLNASGEPTDVTTELAAMLRRVAAERGRLDYVFNNAGVGGTLAFDEADDDHWRRVLSLDLESVIAGTRAAYEIMRARGGGHIVNTASISGLVPFPGQTLYNTAKFGVVGLSTSLRAEAAQHGIRVSVVCPGVVATPIWGTPIRGERRHVEPPADAITPEQAATEILRGVARNRAIIVVPRGARAWAAAYRLMPGLTETVITRRYRSRASGARPSGRKAS